MNTIFCSQGHENPHTNQFCQNCGEKLSPAVVSNLVSGAVLEGRYRLVQQIGQGGFGRTYLCEDLNRFNEPCVLKEFAPQVHGAYALDKAKKLFEREASVLYQLQHPQIPKFRELFQMTSGGGGLFLVQDFVAGQTYRHALNLRLQKGQTFQEDEVRQLLINILPVLEYTHSLGVIHRDIAPDNLICRASDGMPVLIDFGGVKQIAVNAEIQIKGSTEVPTRLGKVGYAPHEQMQRGTVFPHSDLYALAATGLVLLTGQEPTDLIDPQTMTWNWRKVLQLPSGLGEVLDRMLQPKATDRFQSASEVLKALNSQHQPVALPVVQPLPHPSTLGTVVVAPDSSSNTPGSNSQIPTGEAGFWQILSRTWVGILGIAAAIGLVWGATSMLNKPQENLSPSPSTTSPESPAPTPSLTDSPSPTNAETSPSEVLPPVNSQEPTPSVEPSSSSDRTSGRSRTRRRRKSNTSPVVPSSPSPESTDTEQPQPSTSSESTTTPPSKPRKSPPASAEIETPKNNGDLFENNKPPKPLESVEPEPEPKRSTSNSDKSPDNGGTDTAPTETPLF